MKLDLGINVHTANAQDKFLNNLAGVRDPEDKRKIIGHNFIEVFEEYVPKLKKEVEKTGGSID